jgi:hypothetical protein
MKKFFKGLWDAIGTIGGVLIVAAWFVTFLNITFGLALWSGQWLNGLLTNLLNGF